MKKVEKRLEKINRKKYPNVLKVVEQDENGEWNGSTEWKCKVISVSQFNDLKNILITIETPDPEKQKVR